MPTTDQAVTMLSSAISLTLLWALVFWCYREYRVDRFRQRLFSLRGELFDLVRESDVPFDHPAYVHLRSTLNGFLRYSDRISLASTLLNGWTYHHEAEGSALIAEVETRLNASLITLPPDVSVQMLAIRQQMHYELGEQVLLSSPLLVLTLVPFLLIALVRKAGDRLAWMVLRGAYRWGTGFVRTFLLKPLDAIALGAADDSIRSGAITPRHAGALFG